MDTREKQEKNDSWHSQCSKLRKNLRNSSVHLKTNLFRGKEESRKQEMKGKMTYQELELVKKISKALRRVHQ